MCTIPCIDLRHRPPTLVDLGDGNVTSRICSRDRTSAVNILPRQQITVVADLMRFAQSASESAIEGKNIRARNLFFEHVVLGKTPPHRNELNVPCIDEGRRQVAVELIWSAAVCKRYHSTDLLQAVCLQNNVHTP